MHLEIVGLSFYGFHLNQKRAQTISKKVVRVRRHP